MVNNLNESQLVRLNKLLDVVATKQRNDFGRTISDVKEDGTLVTDCDRWSDRTLVQEINNIAKGEGVLSEEGSKEVPQTSAYWVVDPLDGTTNFAAGIPYWAISVARFVNGQPESAFLDLPALQQRIIAIRGKGVWLNGKQLTLDTRQTSTSDCVSLCSRSIRILQRRPDKPFPGKIRLFGVASLNMVSVAIGQTVGAIEATPKIWDLASAWLVLSELMCPIKWLRINPAMLKSGQDLSETDFPVIVASSNAELQRLLPWGKTLLGV